MSDLSKLYFTCSMAAASRDKGHSETRMNVVDADDLLWRRLGAAPLLVRSLIIVHHQFLHLNKALNDRNHPEIQIWDLKQGKW